MSDVVCDACREAMPESQFYDDRCMPCVIATLERQLAEALAALDRCNKTCEMTAECWRNDLAEAQELLKVARCPNSNCDNKGTMAMAHNSDYELQHCQWCHEAGHCCVEDSTPGREG